MLRLPYFLMLCLVAAGHQVCGTGPAAARRWAAGRGGCLLPRGSAL